jgi:glycerol-3-phosphate dehydrogenase
MYTSIRQRDSKIPSRSEHIQALKDKTFDVLIIGGGATGCGIALDAVTRGLSTALVEANDFASGTSSRSTKLLHGGVRYLEKAFTELDKAQFNLVRDALRERTTAMKIAPHLTNKLLTFIPIQNWWQIPYYWIGMKCYDKLSGKRSLGPSTFVSKSTIMKRFPFLSIKRLKGGIAYYDGQFNDARMNISLACTAAAYGASITNYMRVTGLSYEEGRVSGAIVTDLQSKECFPIKARKVVNATGPFSDTIRKMDEEGTKNILTVSSGTHIIVAGEIQTLKGGLLIPKTSDGRVLFLLPWEGETLAGTTDEAAEVTENPEVKEHEIQYILDELNKQFGTNLSKKSVKAAWKGLRPLIIKDSKSTAQISRDHEIITSSSGILSVIGGKWTTYRKMAQDTVDIILKKKEFKAKHRCLTAKIRLIGSHDHLKELKKTLLEKYNITAASAEHLAHSYGSRALFILEGSSPEDRELLIPGFPYLKAEVHYVIEHEYALTAEDILARRLRLNFLDTEASKKALPIVEKILENRNTPVS